MRHQSSDSIGWPCLMTRRRLPRTSGNLRSKEATSRLWPCGTWRRVACCANCICRSLMPHCWTSPTQRTCRAWSFRRTGHCSESAERGASRFQASHSRTVSSGFGAFQTVRTWPLSGRLGRGSCGTCALMRQGVMWLRGVGWAKGLRSLLSPCGAFLGERRSQRGMALPSGSPYIAVLYVLRSSCRSTERGRVING